MKKIFLSGILALFLLGNVFAYPLYSEYSHEGYEYRDSWNIDYRTIKNYEGYSSRDYSPDYKERIYETKYFPEENKIISISRQRNYDNDKRYSTYDYRHGYTYRETRDYWQSSAVLKKKGYYETDRNYYEEKDSSQKSYYIRDIPYLNRQEKIECYNSAPRGKLIYVQCP